MLAKLVNVGFLAYYKCYQELSSKNTAGESTGLGAACTHCSDSGSSQKCVSCPGASSHWGDPKPRAHLVGPYSQPVQSLMSWL